MSRLTLLALALTACAPPPADVCFDASSGLGRDATTGEPCLGTASPIGYSLMGPNVQLLVDRSGSMANANRWAEVQALAPWLPAVTERANLGLTLFPGAAGECSVDAATVEMSSGESASDAVSRQILAASPRGGTPMARALRTAHRDPALSCPNRDNVVVLLTDGIESCGGSPAAEIARLATSDPPVEVYVIGFGVDDASAASLGRMAEAARPSTPAPNFYRAENAGDLVMRLQQVTGTCTMQIHEEVAADELVVALDGRLVDECFEERCGEGFTYDPSDRTVRFEGSDCLALLDGTCHDIAFDRL